MDLPAPILSAGDAVRAIRAGGGRSASPFSLVVDLRDEPIGPRWWRGAATLAALCGCALLLAPMGTAGPVRAGDATDVRMMAFAPVAPAAAEPRVLAPIAPKVDREGPSLRIRGSVAEGLYWSLRDAGVDSAIAADYLRAVASRIDVGADVAPFDRFDLVVGTTPGGPALQYAALHRSQGEDVQLVHWAMDGRARWFDAGAQAETADQMMAPVDGRITSRFGRRVHPIFRYARLHSGVDFGARWGSPIVAAADGMVTAAGWAGGYGRQVRVAHEGGLVTTYSHMSSFAASPGTPVRKGEVIGHVGSSGVSTGPHLHFEVRRNGRPVDPLSVRLASRPVMDARTRAAFAARLKALTAIGEQKNSSKSKALNQG